MKIARVPLDYMDPTAGTAKVALARYPATKEPRKGMVMFNPGQSCTDRALLVVLYTCIGGPGVPGTPLAHTLGPLYQRTYTGEDYDILGFDIRGVGDTT